MRIFFLIITSNLFSIFLYGQEYQSDWDVYLMETNKKPVSIMVDLGIGKAAPLGDKPNLVVLHVYFKGVQSDGMPTPTEMKLLQSAEDEVVSNIEPGLNAVYVGRYTKDGKRDFYFYTNDTSSYHKIFEKSLQTYTSFRWTASARKDNQWSDYFDVLFPPPIEMEKIKNRKVVDKLKAEGDPLTAARKVDHWLYFKTAEGRKNFVFAVQDEKFDVDEAGQNSGVKGYPFSLHISRVDKVDYISIDKVTLHLRELALKNDGKYDGWETSVEK